MNAVLFYRKMNLRQIVDDLLETLSDLVMNAGEHHLEPTLCKLAAVRAGRRMPSRKLVRLMEVLKRYDSNLLDWHAQELMRAAVRETQALCHVAVRGRSGTAPVMDCKRRTVITPPLISKCEVFLAHRRDSVEL
jgi:hypothetical protein